MCAGVDCLERNPVVFWFISPSPRLIGPDNAVALDPAPISPDKAIDGSRIGKEENAVSYQGDLNQFRVAVLNGCNRSSANRFGLKQRRRRDQRSGRRQGGQQGSQQNSPERFYPIHRSFLPTAEVGPKPFGVGPAEPGQTRSRMRVRPHEGAFAPQSVPTLFPHFVRSVDFGLSAVVCFTPRVRERTSPARSMISGKGPLAGVWA